MMLKTYKACYLFIYIIVSIIFVTDIVNRTFLYKRYYPKEQSLCLREGRAQLWLYNN